MGDPPFCESQRRIALRYKDRASRTYFREPDMREVRRRPPEPVEKLPRCPLLAQIRHQIGRFWGIRSPIPGRNRLDAGFFHRLTPF